MCKEKTLSRVLANIQSSLLIPDLSQLDIRLAALVDRFISMIKTDYPAIVDFYICELESKCKD